MVERSPAELDAARAHVEDMQTRGILKPGEYYQILVTLASEYLCRHHDAEQALILLNACPAFYFQEEILAQMQADDDFAAAAFELGYYLLQLGLIEGEAREPTMAPARA